MFIHQKKITALGLLLLVALPLFFSVGIMVKQKIIQLQRSERFQKEVLQTFNIPVEKLCWVKVGKEVLVDGKLFDVKSFRTEGEKISLTGFFDERENKLVSDINDIIHEKKESGNPFSHSSVKFLLVPLFNESTSFSFQNSWYNVTRQFLTYSEVIFKGAYSAPTPPPKYS